MLEIKDPVHGYIKLTELEQRLIDTPEFQRLRRIKQLSGAHYAYPGATHTRFLHSLGALYLAGYIGDIFVSKNFLSKDDLQKLRIAALLHDIGHGPFSHLFEEVIFSKRNLTHEDLTLRVITETNIKDIVESYGFSSKNIANLAIGQSKEDPLYMNEIIGGGLSVDVIDYVLRDAYFTGVEYGQVDVHRLLNSFEVYEKENRLALDYAAIHSLEALFISRYEMFKAVYFHKTVRAAEIMLIQAFMLADDVLDFSNFKSIDSLIELDDESIISRIMHSQEVSLKESKAIIEEVLNRRLIKCVYEKIVHRKDPFIYQLLTQKDVRATLQKAISTHAQVSEKTIFVDVSTAPSLPVNSKRETLNELCVFTKSLKGPTFWLMPLSENVVLNAISGHVDMIRVYTTVENREKVDKVISSIFSSSQDFVSKLSL